MAACSRSVFTLDSLTDDRHLNLFLVHKVRLHEKVGAIFGQLVIVTK